MAEWQNDPSTVNPTPAWGHIGQVTGCQSNLEVGDPLSGTSTTIKLGGFTYHPQELAFFSWFYHQKPSLGVQRLVLRPGHVPYACEGLQLTGSTQ